MLNIRKIPIRRGFVLQEYDEASVGRTAVEKFIALRFEREHGAQLIEFMPTLLAVHDSQGKVVAAAGVRCSADKKLFLESYLTGSVEQVLQSAIDSGTTVKRQDIVEIGNLASSCITGSRFLFRSLYRYCNEGGYQWVVFTSCQRLRKAFEHLNLSLIKLACAEENKLTRSKGSWGRYYLDRPAVMAGYLPDAKAFTPTARNKGCEAHG